MYKVESLAFAPLDLRFMHFQWYSLIRTEQVLHIWKEDIWGGGGGGGILLCEEHGTSLAEREEMKRRAEWNNGCCYLLGRL